MEPNLENEGAKGCYQIVKSNDLESTRLIMSSFLLLYELLVHSIMYLIGLRFNCVFRMTGSCSEIDSEITLHSGKGIVRVYICRILIFSSLL